MNTTATGKSKDQALACPKENSMNHLPSVYILATGGTIAGSAVSATQSGYSSGKLDIQGLLKVIPNLEHLARVQGEQLSNVGSQDMSFEIMTRLAKRVNALLARNDVDGIVITHGTDTMEETAFFLNLVVDSTKPVVMTGAMRPATALSADGPLNIFNAVAVAAHVDAGNRGVMVVMNDRIHGAHSLTKSNTTSVETFLSPINGLMGTVVFGAVKFFRSPFRKHTLESEFRPEYALPLPRVDIVYACADMPPDLIAASATLGAKGIVIAGDGNGNMSKEAIRIASELSAKGICIVRASRVPTGTVSRNVEVDDDRFGFIVSDELNPPKARILLMMALQKVRSLASLQSLFYQY
ncbi:MAG: L-asparaginase 2 [Desulfobacterales bacterium]|nr:MAG: L-asparaginase 2 [Desulfobacterales bacterium]